MVADEVIAKLSSKKLEERLDASVLALNELDQRLTALSGQEHVDDAQIKKVSALKDSTYSFLYSNLANLGSAAQLQYLVGGDGLPGLNHQDLRNNLLLYLACSGKNVTVARKAVDHLAQVEPLEKRLGYLKTIVQKGKTHKKKKGAAFRAFEKIYQIDDLNARVDGFSYAVQNGQEKVKEDAKKKIESLVNQAYSSEDMPVEDKTKIYFAGLLLGDVEVVRKTVKGALKINDPAYRNYLLKNIFNKSCLTAEAYPDFIRVLKNLDQSSREDICKYVSTFTASTSFTDYAKKYLAGVEVLSKKLRELGP